MLLTAAPNCAADGDPLHCRMVKLLHLLYISAGVLGLVLVVIAIVAWAAYRRNRTRQLEEDRRR